jgi:predicted nucleotidyltransferase
MKPVLHPGERRTVEALASRLRQEFSNTLLEVRLYGSKARGDASPESDIDILAVFSRAPSPEQEDNVRNFLYDLDLENGTVTQLLIVEEEWWDSPVTKVTLFRREVLEQGVAL